MRRNRSYMAGIYVVLGLSLALAGACDKQEDAALEQQEQPLAQPAAAPEGHAEHGEGTAHAAHGETGPEMPAAPAGASVTFLEPAPGATLEGPLEDGKVQVQVKMGAEGIAVKPAGEVEAGSGHHHLLIDKQPLPAGQGVPKDEQHMHFGGGQTEATVGLTPGNHTLVLQFADGLHRSYGPSLSATISVTVAAAQGASLR